MPQMDGLSFLRALRGKSLPLSSIPALVTTTEDGASPRGRSARGRREFLRRQAAEAGNAGGVRRSALRGSGMNEFLQQFLIESRELVDQAVEDLLALEKTPSDAERFDDAFRAFHTLKGGAGIVDFAAMQEALHCAEDALAASRAAARPVSALDIGNCLMCLDQVVEWLDAIESTGDLPPDADARRVLARFASAADEPNATPADADAAAAWLVPLRGAHPAAAAQAQTAVRYRPPADSFFRHQDPVARIAALPGLLALDIAPRAPWPPLDELDPFACNLVITALCAASSADTAAALGDEIRHCDVEALGNARERRAPASASLREHASCSKLRWHCSPRPGAQEHGRIASAGLAAANVLRHIGNTAAADHVAAAAAASIAESNPQRLRQALATALGGAPSASAAEPAAARRARRPHADTARNRRPNRCARPADRRAHRHEKRDRPRRQARRERRFRARRDAEERASLPRPPRRRAAASRSRHARPAAAHRLSTISPADTRDVGRARQARNVGLRGRRHGGGQGHRRNSRGAARARAPQCDGPWHRACGRTRRRRQARRRDDPPARVSRRGARADRNHGRRRRNRHRKGSRGCEGTQRGMRAKRSPP